MQDGHAEQQILDAVERCCRYLRYKGQALLAGASVLLAVEGPRMSGKSTLARELSLLLNVPPVHNTQEKYSWEVDRRYLLPMPSQAPMRLLSLAFAYAMQVRDGVLLRGIEEIREYERTYPIVLFDRFFLSNYVYRRLEQALIERGKASRRTDWMEQPFDLDKIIEAEARGYLYAGLSLVVTLPQPKLALIDEDCAIETDLYLDVVHKLQDWGFPVCVLPWLPVEERASLVQKWIQEQYAPFLERMRSYVDEVRKGAFADVVGGQVSKDALDDASGWFRMA